LDGKRELYQHMVLDMLGEIVPVLRRIHQIADFIKPASDIWVKKDLLEIKWMRFFFFLSFYFINALWNPSF